MVATPSARSRVAGSALPLLSTRRVTMGGSHALAAAPRLCQDHQPRRGVHGAAAAAGVRFFRADEARAGVGRTLPLGGRQVARPVVPHTPLGTACWGERPAEGSGGGWRLPPREHPPCVVLLRWGAGGPPREIVRNVPRAGPVEPRPSGAAGERGCNPAALAEATTRGQLPPASPVGAEAASTLGFSAAHHIRPPQLRRFPSQATLPSRRRCPSPAHCPRDPCHYG